MKWTHVCPLLGVTLLACATGENNTPDGLGLSAGAANAGGSSETGGTTAGTGPGTSGSFASGGAGGSSNAGSSNAGTFSSGATSFAGTFSSGGVTATAGASGAGGTAAGAGGAGGAGGKASGGAAGAGGKASGGAGGSGGSAVCIGTTVPAKTSWKGSSMPIGAYPAAKAFDGDNATRFATGTKQAGGEWLEIDFGEVVTLNEITMFTNNGDYFRHYQLRMSNTSGDFAAPILNEADGVQGSIVVPLAKAQAGQYLTIRQTGAVAAGETAWWSLHEVSVACK